MKDAQIELPQCEVCEKDVHRSSSLKHLKSKLHEDNEKLNPSNFLIEPKPSTSKKYQKCTKIKRFSERKNQSLK